MATNMFSVCYQDGNADGWTFEEFANVMYYSHALELVKDGAGLGSGYAIFMDGVRILPGTKEANHELNVDRKREISRAMDLLQFNKTSFSEILEDCLPDNIEDMVNACHYANAVLDKNGLAYTDEIHQKRVTRMENKVSEPVPFYVRHPIPTDIDDLPF